VYRQLQVWQDFNQDGRNVHGLVGPASRAAANDARWAMVA
jgi:hypothetical protein